MKPNWLLFLILAPIPSLAQTQLPADSRGYPISPPTVNSPITIRPDRPQANNQLPWPQRPPAAPAPSPQSSALPQGFCGSIAAPALPLTLADPTGKCPGKQVRMPASDGKIYCAALSRAAPVNCITSPPPPAQPVPPSLPSPANSPAAVNRK